MGSHGGNQRSLEAEAADDVRSAAEEVVVSKPTIKKCMDPIKMRINTASSWVDWIVSEPSYSGELRFTNMKTVGVLSMHRLFDVEFKDDLSRDPQRSRGQDRGHRAPLRARPRTRQHIQPIPEQISRLEPERPA